MLIEGSQWLLRIALLACDPDQELSMRSPRAKKLLPAPRAVRLTREIVQMGILPVRVGGNARLTD